MNKKGFALIELLIVVVIISIIGLIVYLRLDPNTIPVPVAPKPTVSPTPEVVLKTYENSKYHFSFEYPANLNVVMNTIYTGDNYVTLYYESADPIRIRFGTDAELRGDGDEANSLQKSTVSNWTRNPDVSISPLTWESYTSPQTCSPEECMRVKNRYYTNFNDTLGTIVVIDYYEGDQANVDFIQSHFSLIY